MSYWTYLTGTVTVRPMGRTQAEKRYILDTVLEHLPLVTGSERDMNVYVIQKNGDSSSSSCDEFGEVTNNLVDSYGNKVVIGVGLEPKMNIFWLLTVHSETGCLTKLSESL